MTCTGKTKAGAACRRAALRGREVCHAHSGATVGRPPALTPAVHERFVQAKQLGCPDRVAAQLAGISETTYYELMKKGTALESGPEHEFVEAIGRAEAQAFMRAMASWTKGRTTDWRAGRPSSSTTTESTPPPLAEAIARIRSPAVALTPPR